MGNEEDQRSCGRGVAPSVPLLLILCVVVVACALVMGAAWAITVSANRSTSSAPPGGATGAGTSVVDTDEYSYTLPAGWRIGTPDEIAQTKQGMERAAANAGDLPAMTSLAVGFVGADPEGANFNVTEEPADPHLAPGDYQQGDLAALRDSSPDLRIVAPPRPTTLAGEPASISEFHTREIGPLHAGTELGFVEITSIHAGRAYMLTFTTALDDLETAHSSFDRIANSWRWRP